MKTRPKQSDRTTEDVDVRDAIIHTLYVWLKAERETRETIAEAARGGAAAAVIEAMACDPVPPIDDLGRVETVQALVRYFRNSHIPASREIEGGG
jgi:hypothetical protein